MGLYSLLVLDIDGTLADCSHRLALVQDINSRFSHLSGPEKYDEMNKLWNQFYLACEADTVIPGTVESVAWLTRQVRRVVYLTGRSEVCKSQTQNWLERNGFPKAEIRMRGLTDYRKSVDVKREHLDVLSGFETIHALVDDEPDILRMAYMRGIQVHHAPHCWSYLPR